MDTTTSSPLEAANAGLPRGYRAREFRDSDREPLVAERNAHVHELQQGTAEEWREWERLDPEVGRLRIVVQTTDGAIAASANVGSGFMPRPDGTLSGDVATFRAHRGRGLARALLPVIEGEARRRGAPRILAGADSADPDGAAWAGRHGYREIGRRIESYVMVGTFDPALFDELERVRASGIALRDLHEILAGRDAAAAERFWRELYEADAPMWEDVPWATPTPHLPWEKFRKMMVESGKIVPEATIVAFDGETIAGYTSTGRSGTDRGYTYMTGVARGYRGRGIATALKLAMLAGAKRAGLRAMLTTNDEPNKAMRGINAKLGYVMLPARIELEKRLT